MTTRWATDISLLRRVAFDSNALIYAIEHDGRYAALVGALLGRLQSGETSGVVSTVVEMEVLTRPVSAVVDLSFTDRVETFLQTLPNVTFRAVDRIVARRAAALRSTTRLPAVDSLIAASAMEEDCEAIVGNDALFRVRLAGMRYLHLDDYL